MEKPTAEQVVKAKYPDAEMYIALFAGGKFAVGSPAEGVTISAAFRTRPEAWADAAARIETQKGEDRG